MQRLPAPTLLCAALLLSVSAQAEDYYKYVRPDGRVVYTNITEQVPLEQRERGKLDLSRISLNSELGAELDRGFAAEHAELRESTYCQALRAAAEVSLLERIWEDFAPLVVCGAVMLAFVLFTPYAMRAFGAPVWAKTLMMAIPSLAIAGLVAFTMNHTNKAIVKLKEQVKPCAAESFAELRSEPDALAKRSQMIEELRREVTTLEVGGYGTVAAPGAPRPE